MKYFAILLIGSFIIKDVIYINDPYLMRGIAELLGLISVGVWAFSRYFSVKILLKYWMLFCYVFTLFISSLYSNNIIFVFLQVISLLLVILIFIAHYEYKNEPNIYFTDNKYLFNTSAVMIWLITTVSLILYIIYPQLVIDMDNDFRFHGLYGKSAMIASASAILIGIALLGNYKTTLKIFLFIPGIACLALTNSRTFWVASIISLMLVLYIYKIVSKKLIIVGIIIISLGSLCLYLMNYKYRNVLEVARPESISNFSGRVEMWKISMEAFYTNPLIGNGLTAGSEVFSRKGGVSIYSKPVNTGREMSRRTAHNGYVQSLLDSGIVGSIFYLLIVIYSIVNMVKYDKKFKYPVELFILIFMTIANIGESMIYAASMYSSTIYWAMTIKSFSLKRSG